MVELANPKACDQKGDHFPFVSKRVSDLWDKLQLKVEKLVTHNE